MMELVVEIPSGKWGNQRSLKLDKGFKDALRDYCKQRWPHHTAKYAARAFDLTVDQGRAVANGTPSITTIEKALKKGGPVVAVPVLEEVLGVNLAGLFRLGLISAAEGACDAVDHEQRARAAYRRLADPADQPRDGGDDPTPAGQARRSFGALGAPEARGVARR